MVRAYLAGGLVFAAVISVSFLLAFGENASVGAFALLACIYAWPVVLALNLVRNGKLLVFGVIVRRYFLALAVVFTVALIQGVSLAELLVLWLINLPVTLLLALFLVRKVRAVGPLLLGFNVTAVFGANALFGLVEGRERAFLDVGSWFGLGAYGVALALILVGFGVVGRMVGGPLLRWVSDLYDKKNLNDQSLTIDSLWLFFGAIYGVFLMNLGAIWGLSAAVAFIAYKVVSTQYFRASSVAPDGAGPRLLQLRTFSPGDRSQRLHYAFGQAWRYSGSILMIAGPDLARTTVEPGDFFTYVKMRLPDLFIENHEKIDRRIERIDTEPDIDGRYRVGTFFCYENTWQLAVQRLLGQSDAVMMDLRGFTAGNHGCVLEIQFLFNLMPLERVVFIIDSKTEMKDLKGVVTAARAQMSPDSPNAGVDRGEPWAVRMEQETRSETRRLLSAVCAAACGERPATTGSAGAAA